MVIEEIAPPDCKYLPCQLKVAQDSTEASGVFAGSVFVSRRARAFFEGEFTQPIFHSSTMILTFPAEKLKASKYGTPDSLDHITKRFDETTKRLFRDLKELQFVPFGSPLDRDATVGIRGGQLKLTGCVICLPPMLQ